MIIQKAANNNMEIVETIKGKNCIGFGEYLYTKGGQHNMTRVLALPQQDLLRYSEDTAGGRPAYQSDRIGSSHASAKC